MSKLRRDLKQHLRPLLQKIINKCQIGKILINACIKENFLSFPKLFYYVRTIADLMDDLFDFSQGSADSNYSQPSSDLSLDEEKETLRREKEKQALNQLQKARVSH